MSALIKLRQARLRRMEELEQQKQGAQSLQPTNKTSSTAGVATSNEDDENDRDANDRTNKSTNTNLFAAALGDDDDDIEHDDDDTNATAASPAQHDDPEISDVTNVSTASASRRRRPKRSAKSKSKTNSSAATARHAHDDDDIDDISSSLSSASVTSSDDTSSSSSAASPGWSLLSTSYAHFDERNEIRARFGSASLREAGAPSSSRRRMTIRARASGTNAGGGSSSSVGRKTVLVKPHSDWPPITDRATIKMIRLSHNAFTFITTPEATRLASEYASTVASHDVQQLMFFAQHHPYYAPAAMTVADICESQGEFSMAHQVIQRALLLFELSCHQTFDFGRTGYYRLLGEHSDNKMFLTLLTRHAQMTAKKGCPRTALEICKLVISLSPVNDPTCVLPIIDYYAIRCTQYQWLLDLPYKLDTLIINDESIISGNAGEHPWKRIAIPTITRATAVPTRIHSLNSSTSAAPVEATVPAPPPLPPRPPCILTPNLIYSRALARWYIEGAEARNIPSLDNTTIIRPPRLPFAATLDQTTDDQLPLHLASSDDSSVSSTVLLAQAITLFPEVLDPLLKLAGLERELEKSEWKSTISSIGSLYAAHPHIDKLVLVFTERSATLWKRDAIVSWLSSTASAVARRLSDGSIPKRAFENVRKTFFPPPSNSSQSSSVPPALRSLQRTSFTDKIPHLPPEMLMAQHEAAMEDDRAEADMMTAAGRRRLMAENGQIPLDLERHPLEVFLRSIFPQYVVEQVVDRQQHGDDDHPAPRRGGLVPVVAGEGVAGQDDLLEPVDGDIEIINFIDDDDVPEEDIGEFGNAHHHHHD